MYKRIIDHIAARLGYVPVKSLISAKVEAEHYHSAYKRSQIVKKRIIRDGVEAYL